MLRAGRGRGLSPPTTLSSPRLCLRLLSLAPHRFLLRHGAASVGRSGWWGSSRSALCAKQRDPAGSESGIPAVPLEIPIVCNLSVCNLSGDDSGVKHSPSPSATGRAPGPPQAHFCLRALLPTVKAVLVPFSTPTQSCPQLGSTSKLMGKIQKESERENAREEMGEPGPLAGREQRWHGAQDAREGVKKLGGMT